MKGLGLINGMDQSTATDLINLINSRIDDPATRSAILQNLVSGSGSPVPDTLDATSKALYQARLAQLPEDVIQRLLTGVEQVCDMEYYSVVALGASATNITHLFAQDGAKDVGLRNVSNQKLDAGIHFLCTAIELLYGIDASTGEVATFSFLEMPAPIFNGEIEISQDGRKILPKQSMHCFWNGIATSFVDTTHFYVQARTICRLNNPKWILPQQEIKGSIEWGGAAPGAANSYLKIRLLGAANFRS